MTIIKEIRLVCHILAGLEGLGKKTSKSRLSATISQPRRSVYRYRFFEKVSDLAGTKLGKKFSAPPSLV